VELAVVRELLLLLGVDLPPGADARDSANLRVRDLPLLMASAMRGSLARALAVRTFSRAAPRSRPTLQESQ
jgi:hypothetical protein